jgi:hypothetical protein
MEKRIRCRNCHDGEMVTRHTTQFNGWGITAAVACVATCVYFIWIPLLIVVAFERTPEVGTWPVVIWAGFWLLNFISSLCKVNKKVATWCCEACDYSYIKGHA